MCSLQPRWRRILRVNSNIISRKALVTRQGILLCVASSVLIRGRNSPTFHSANRVIWALPFIRNRCRVIHTENLLVYRFTCKRERERNNVTERRETSPNSVWQAFNITLKFRKLAVRTLCIHIYKCSCICMCIWMHTKPMSSNRENRDVWQKVVTVNQKQQRLYPVRKCTRCFTPSCPLPTSNMYYSKLTIMLTFGSLDYYIVAILWNQLSSTTRVTSLMRISKFRRIETAGCGFVHRKIRKFVTLGTKLGCISFSYNFLRTW